MGGVRATLVLAAIELGRRALTGRPMRGQRLAGASEVWTYLGNRLASLAVEEFWALGLDARHRVQSEHCLARGSLTGVEIHPRDVFRPLIRHGTAAVIFCHNHPSGDPAPSRADVDLTTRLREVGDLCGIPVLDHVVVGWEGYVSLCERNWRTDRGDHPTRLRACPAIRACCLSRSPRWPSPRRRVRTRSFRGRACWGWGARRARSPSETAARC